MPFEAAGNRRLHGLRGAARLGGLPPGFVSIGFRWETLCLINVRKAGDFLWFYALTWAAIKNPGSILGGIFRLGKQSFFAMLKFFYNLHKYPCKFSNLYRYSFFLI